MQFLRVYIVTVLGLVGGASAEPLVFWVRLRLVTSQGSPYPSRSPRAHPSGWTSNRFLVSYRTLAPTKRLCEKQLRYRLWCSSSAILRALQQQCNFEKRFLTLSDRRSHPTDPAAIQKQRRTCRTEPSKRASSPSRRRQPCRRRRARRPRRHRWMHCASETWPTCARKI